MEKYKLIHKTTGEEHLCEEVVENFKYYISNEPIDKSWKGWAYKEDVTGKIFKHYYTGNKWYSDAKKVIATTNPNIDVPKVIDDVEDIGLKYVLSLPNSEYLSYDVQGMIEKSHLNGYNKHAETHPYSEEDMVEFLEWTLINGWRKLEGIWEFSNGDVHKTTKELLELWKSQQSKVLYYE